MQNKILVKEGISKEKILNTLYLLKAQDIVTINMKTIPNTFCDYFIVAHGTSPLQIRSIAENLVDDLRKQYYYRPHHIEGMQNAEWILIDYDNIIVHIFLEKSRRFYNLENLWADTEIEKYDEVI